MCFGVTSLWIESSLTSGAALHIQISCILCTGSRGVRGEGVLRYACEEALETTQPQAPHSLSFGAKRTRKRMHVLKFTTFPKMCRTHAGQQIKLSFHSKCPMSRKISVCSCFVDCLSCDQRELAVEHPEGPKCFCLVCGSVCPADYGGQVPDLGS